MATQTGYYVSIVRGKQVGLLLGPFPQHDAALAAVDWARERAIEIDLWAHFDAFGTLKLERDCLPCGVLSKEFEAGWK